MSNAATHDGNMSWAG